ncbi:MAG TPA: TraR/DksA C4-type zinc finger protein [Chloroflexota bacterium]|nr:TraR/DksA C4-type zinc finger protein [Chloroflexota bacterium]
MPEKSSRNPESESNDDLETKSRRLSQLRRYVDESTFSDDERGMKGDLSTADQHPSDTADFTFERELMETTREIIDEESAQTHEAMRRKAEGTYGICAECGKPIAPKRLRARPQATLCIDCQRDREEQRRAQAS